MRKGQETARQGIEKKPNRSSLTKEEEEVLWQNGLLRGGTPRTLLNTMWWLLTQQLLDLTVLLYNATTTEARLEDFA